MESIKTWALDDRPREKMESHGANVLSKAELLAILVGSGIPGKSAVGMMREILNDYNDSLKLLGLGVTMSTCHVPGWRHTSEPWTACPPHCPPLPVLS